MKSARNFAIVALIALLLVVLPGGGPAVQVVLTLLTIAFFAAIAYLGLRLFREYRLVLESFESRQRLVLYSAIGLAFLAFAATQRLFDQGGLGVLAWLALLGIASYGVFWVYSQYRRYD